jgi:glucose-6-phosphate 1-dehydrogenase
MADGIKAFSEPYHLNESQVKDFVPNCLLCHGSSRYFSLSRVEITTRNDNGSAPGNIVFYLSLLPSLFGPHCDQPGFGGTQPGTSGFRRLIVEKPFGYDLASSHRLNEDLHATFKEEQIYRIDHYLGKETVQNLLVLRFSNGILEPLWNRNYVHHVEITSAESLGVGNRGGYYEGLELSGICCRTTYCRWLVLRPWSPLRP